MLAELAVARKAADVFTVFVVSLLSMGEPSLIVSTIVIGESPKEK